MNNDKINRMTAKEYYKSSRMVETRNWTLEMALNFAEEYTEALRIHDVSGQLPNNLILYRQAKKLDYAEFCKWLNAKLGNLR